MDKGILTEIKLNEEHNGLFSFNIQLKDIEDNSFVVEGDFYSDLKNPLKIGQEYEYSCDGYDNGYDIIVIKGFLPKAEILKKIDAEKPHEVKVIEELRAHSTILKRISFRIGWFYYWSIISLLASLIFWLYILSS